mgnify:CR=1 FL=1
MHDIIEPYITVCWLSETEDILNRQPNEKINYLYGRLSHEDELQGDSNSIINQRKILTRYAEENGFTPYQFVYDDGFSGADFQRPAFSRMMEDVEAGKVATVIVKDMSRFGRDYLKVGFYTEIVFAEKDVRLIAINDNVDTEHGENDFAPMMNLFNEWFLRNTSKKIRAVWQAKGKSGERLAVIPPYGYRKDPENSPKLIIDEESAARRATAIPGCSPAWPTVPTAGVNCISTRGPFITRPGRKSAMRAHTVVPNIARMSSICSIGNAPAITSRNPRWNRLCWKNCGNFSGSSHRMKSGSCAL